jgi:hydrogenase maturation protein HypF
MPGGDLATTYPERMLFGILPGAEVQDLLLSRGWTEMELAVLETQLAKSLNVAKTSSTGRVLDAVSALLGICREKTYDGEPAMKL